MTHECEIMKEAVIDLAYDELSEDKAEQLRMHAADCTKCRNILEQILLTRKMAAQLPPIDPGNSIDNAVLEIARSATSRQSELGFRQIDKQNENILSTQTTIEKAPTILDRFRGFLLAPALVTASIAAIVFVTSFFLIEKGAPQDQLYEARKLQSPSTSEAVNSIAESPSSKSKLVAIKIGEKTNNQDSQLSQGTKNSSRKPGSPELNKDLSVATNSISPPHTNNGNLGTAGPGHLPREKENTLANTKSSFKKERRSAGTFSDEPLDGFDLGDSPSPAASQPIVPQPTQEIDSLSSQQLQQKKDATPNSDLQNGLEAYRRGDCKVATAHFNSALNHSSTTTSQAAIAIHHLARCEKRRGRCASAIPWYDQLLGQHRTYPQRAAALLEAANCQRRLGHNDHARQIYKKLAQIPGWESKAQRELENLDSNLEPRK
jgi:TolA-binding protein